MDVFSSLSIRNKLVAIILISTLLSLGIGFAVVIRSSLQQFEEDLIRTTETITSAVGNYTALPLAFEDREESTKALEPVQQLEDVTDVYLYSVEQGQPDAPADVDRPHPVLFDWYSRSGELSPPPRVLQTGSELRDGFVHCFRPVVFFGQQYGIIYVRVSAASLQARVRGYLLSMAALMAALSVGSVGIAWLLQRVISKPILELANAARQISQEADYSVRVGQPRGDEIGVLYEGFNAMLDQIQQRQEELERSNRDLDQFAYVASHDLKAPLRAISTLAGWIEEDLDAQISADSKEQLRLLRSRVRRMDGLIEGILQYSRVGRLDSGTEKVDVGELVRELVEVLAPPAGMVVEIGPGMPVLETKRLRLEQVFLNLIGNALKYHPDPEKGRLEISTQKVGETYRFTVADDGPGIDPRHHERIFLMFQTLQPRDKVESTGLGLSLVAKLVEEEGGEVSVDSAVGEGAAFSFTWPAMEASASADGSSKAEE